MHTVKSPDRCADTGRDNLLWFFYDHINENMEFVSHYRINWIRFINTKPPWCSYRNKYMNVTFHSQYITIIIFSPSEQTGFSVTVGEYSCLPTYIACGLTAVVMWNLPLSLRLALIIGLFCLNNPPLIVYFPLFTEIVPPSLALIYIHSYLLFEPVLVGLTARETVVQLYKQEGNLTFRWTYNYLLYVGFVIFTLLQAWPFVSEAEVVDRQLVLWTIVI